MTRTGWLLAVIIVLGAGRFLPGCAATEFVLDDAFIIEGNPVVRENGVLAAWSTPWWSMVPPDQRAPNWRPLTLASFAAQHAVAGTPPPAPLPVLGWRAVNLLCYAGLIWLVWRLARTLCGADPPALLATLLFAMHPAHAEAVVPIVGRADLFATAAVVAGCIAWLRFRETAQPRWQLAAAACFLAGLGSKESAAPFLLIVPLLDHWVVSDDARPAWRARLVSYVPLVAVTVVWLLARWAVLGGSALHQPGAGDGLLAGALGFGRNAVWSLVLFVWPAWTHHIITTLPAEAPWHYPPLVPSAGSLLALLAAVAVCTGWWALRRRAPRGAFLWAAAVLCWLPASGLVPIGAGVALRFLFTSSVFACIGIALVWEPVWARIGDSARAVQTVGVVVVACAGVVWGGVYAAQWRDLITFHESVLRQVPECYGSLVTAGGQWHRRGDSTTARAYLERAVAIDPARPGAYRNLYIVYSFGDGEVRFGLSADMPKAETALARWRAAAPRSWEPWYQQGLLQHYRDDIAGARRSFNEALTRAPPPGLREQVEGLLAGR